MYQKILHSVYDMAPFSSIQFALLLARKQLIPGQILIRVLDAAPNIFSTYSISFVLQNNR